MIARESVKVYLVHVALCCRIRQDKTGRAEGVEAQEKWGREYAMQTWAGVPVVLYGDNDISAANRDPRLGYNRLRQAIRDGQVAHLCDPELERNDNALLATAPKVKGASRGDDDPPF